MVRVLVVVGPTVRARVRVRVRVRAGVGPGQFFQFRFNFRPLRLTMTRSFLIFAAFSFRSTAGVSAILWMMSVSLHMGSLTMCEYSLSSVSSSKSCVLG